MRIHLLFTINGLVNFSIILRVCLVELCDNITVFVFDCILPQHNSLLIHSSSRIIGKLPTQLTSEWLVFMNVLYHYKYHPTSYWQISFPLFTANIFTSCLRFVFHFKSFVAPAFSALYLIFKYCFKIKRPKSALWIAADHNNCRHLQNQMSCKYVIYKISV